VYYWPDNSQALFLGNQAYIFINETTFMLDELKQNEANALNVHQLQELFNVEYHFALKRLEQYITKTQIF